MWKVIKETPDIIICVICCKVTSILAPRQGEEGDYILIATQSPPLRLINLTVLMLMMMMS